MFGIGMPELIVILVIVLIIFGAGKLPEIGAGMGKAIRNFKGVGLQLLRVVFLVGVPGGIPVFGNAQPDSCRMYLLTHYACPVLSSATVTVM